MNTTMTMKWAAALMLAATMTANAQGPGAGGPPQGGPQGGDFQPPNPAEIAKKILADFDADKDGKLSVEELQKSVEARHAQHKQGGMQGGPQGGPGGMRQGGPGMMQGGRGPQGGGPGGMQGGPQGGGQMGERPAMPDPDQIATKWLEEFDADKNGALAPEELKKALAAHRPPQGGMRGGPGGQRGPGGPGQQGGGF